MKHILTALTLSAALASPAWSLYTSFGNGNTTCGEFVELHDEHGKLSSYEQWMWGFFSGVNYSFAAHQGKSSRVGAEKFKAIYAAVLKHCREEPLDIVLNATEDVFEQLR